MKHLLLTLLFATFCATGYGQTLKSVMIDTNGVQVNQFGSGSATNPAIKLGATNWGFWRATGPDRIFVSVNGSTGATFTSNSVAATTFSGNLSGGVTIGSGQSISFSGGANVSGTRTNLSLGATWLTNTDVSNFRTAIGLGATNSVEFGAINGSQIVIAGTNIAETGIISGGGFYISDENTDTTATVFEFGGDAAERLRANARTNIGIPLPALTNTSNVTTMRALAGSTNTNEPFSGTLYLLDVDSEEIQITVSNGIILNAVNP
jgi:hypothetical protein